MRQKRRHKITTTVAKKNKKLQQLFAPPTALVLPLFDYANKDHKIMMSSTGAFKNNDEYTDYSCSTSMERLARDVETLLRSWHVDKGNDRHISASNRSTLLLRQDTLLWNLSLTDRMGRPISLSIDLELSLWDGPENELDDEEASRFGCSGRLVDLLG